MNNNDNDKLDLTKEIALIKSGKILYIISFAVAFVLAVFYAVVSSPVYHNEAVILIEDDPSTSSPLQGLLGGSSQMSNLFTLSGLGSSSIDDELVILHSHDCYKQAVSNLGTNRTYSERVGLHKLSLYGKSPVLVEAPNAFFDTITTALKFTITLTGNGSAKAKVSTGFLGLKTLVETQSQTLPFQVKTPYGDFQLLKTDFYDTKPEQVGRKINVQLTRNDYAAEALQKVLEIAEVDKKSNAVELDFDIPDAEYGRDMIGSLIASYRMMRRQHKADKAASKISFLNKRIEILTEQLQTSENDVQEYMKENSLIDVDTQTELLLRQSTLFRDSIFVLKTKQSINQAILDVIKDPSNEYQLLAFEKDNKLIESYNELILKRTEMLHSAKPGNLMLKNIENRIAEMRNKVIEQTGEDIKYMDIMINSLNKQVGNETSALGTMPMYKIEMLNNERDLQLQNNLLIYLLQERENALLSLNSEDEAGFVVDQPFTAKKTVKTKMIIMALLLFIMAAICPTVWLFWRDSRKKRAELAC